MFCFFLHWRFEPCGTAHMGFSGLVVLFVGWPVKSGRLTVLGRARDAHAHGEFRSMGRASHGVFVQCSLPGLPV